VRIPRLEVVAIGFLSVLLGAEPVSGQLFESASVADTGLQPSSLTIAGASLVVSNFGGDTLQSFPIDAQCQIDSPGTVGTGRGPLAVALDDSNSLVYVTYFTDNELGVFSIGGEGLEEIGRYATGRGPVGVAVAAERDLVFVSNVFDGTISVFTGSGRDLELQEVVPTLTSPRNLTIDAEGRFLFAADERNAEIATLGIETDGSVRPISKYLMQGPAEDLLAHPTEPVLYVTQGEDNRILALRIGAQGQLSQIASTSFEGIEERHDELGGLGLTAPFPAGLSIDPRERRLFIAGRLTSDVHAYRAQVDGALEPLGSFPVFEYPEDLVFDPSSECLYVISSAYGQILGIKVLQ
jgi:DNA-binding beta-propeller fold protein YncE